MPTFRRGAGAAQGCVQPPTLPGTPVGAASAADGWERGSAATATPAAAAAALSFPRAATTTTAAAAGDAEGVCPRPTVVGVTPVRSPSIALPRAASAASAAAAPASAVATPEMLWVVSPEMPEAAGCFALQRSETVNGMPAWRCAQRWLYCNSGGGWMLAADADDVRCNRGWAASAAAHGGRLPHQHGAWEAADGRGGWQALRHLRVTERAPLLPARVTVRSPSHPEVSGEYALSAPGDHRNGFAYWACGEKRLYSGEGGWWLVDPDQKHMELDRGLLASTHKHGGLPPTEMETWEVADGQGGWLRDERCVVAPAPAPAPAAAAPAPAAAPTTRQAAAAQPAAEDELEQLRMRTLERERKMMEEINGLRDQLANAKASKGLLQADFDAAEEAARRLRSEALDRSAKEAGLQAAAAAAAAALEKEKAASAALREAASVLERDAAEVEKEVAFTRKDLASARALADSLRHEVRQRGKLAERQRRDAASAAAAAEALLRGARGEAAAARAELAAAHEVNAAVTGRCAEQEARADAAEAALAEERVARRRHVDAVRAAAEAAVQAATDSLLLVAEGAAADAAAVPPLPQPLPLPVETEETTVVKKKPPRDAEEDEVATAAAGSKVGGGEKVRSSRRTDSPKGKKSAQILKRASAAKSALAGWAPQAAAAAASEK